MTLFGIIFWSLIISVIVVYIVYEYKQTQKKKKAAEAEKQKKEEINKILLTYNKRYTSLKNELTKFGEKKQTDKARQLLDDTYTKYYRKFDRDSILYDISRLEKELIVLENSCKVYREKSLFKQEQALIFTALLEQLQQEISICERLSLSEEQRKVLSTVKNRLKVDTNKADKYPQEAIRRTQSSLRKLQPLIK
ncbi:TPA: hypothetical protein DIC40_06305 [Patescibacteria group bacterium]|nr:hypothetical protein P148_SR1C00001G0097 [candidate division SR1 bacterium RAAC1_SR1_1]HCY21419.1 hypothetical protein [Candidatus Gracilibacteria bacterium]